MKRQILPLISKCSLFGFVGVLLFCPILISADEEIVKVEVRLSKDKVHAGDTFKVAFLVSITPGYHINGRELDDPYLIPTELSLEDMTGLEVEEIVFPRPTNAKFPYSEYEVPVYEGEIILGALIHAGKGLAPGSHKVAGELAYQPCNNQSCLFPAEVKVLVPFEIIPSPQPTAEINQELFAKIKFKKDKN